MYYDLRALKPLFLAPTEHARLRLSVLNSTRVFFAHLRGSYARRAVVKADVTLSNNRIIIHVYPKKKHSFLSSSPHSKKKKKNKGNTKKATIAFLTIVFTHVKKKKKDISVAKQYCGTLIDSSLNSLSFSCM